MAGRGLTILVLMLQRREAAVLWQQRRLLRHRGCGEGRVRLLNRKRVRQHRGRERGAVCLALGARRGREGTCGRPSVDNICIRSTHTNSNSPSRSARGRDSSVSRRTDWERRTAHTNSGRSHRRRGCDEGTPSQSRRHQAALQLFRRLLLMKQGASGGLKREVDRCGHDNSSV